MGAYGTVSMLTIQLSSSGYLTKCSFYPVDTAPASVEATILSNSCHSTDFPLLYSTESTATQLFIQWILIQPGKMERLVEKKVTEWIEKLIIKRLA